MVEAAFVMVVTGDIFSIYPGENTSQYRPGEKEGLMDPASRKAAVAAYKERESVSGVYAVLCTATGEAWVGCSSHVDTRRNGLWFELRLGTSRHNSLQAAWSEHGEGEFRFEELDRLRPDFPKLRRSDELQKRATLWRERLAASPL